MNIKVAAFTVSEKSSFFNIWQSNLLLILLLLLCRHGFCDVSVTLSKSMKSRPSLYDRGWFYGIGLCAWDWLVSVLTVSGFAQWVCFIYRKYVCILRHQRNFGRQIVKVTLTSELVSRIDIESGAYLLYWGRYSKFGANASWDVGVSHTIFGSLSPWPCIWPCFKNNHVRSISPILFEIGIPN